MQVRYRNKNRGYQQLRVWQDAIEFYVACCHVFRPFPFELRRVVSQETASADSVHRRKEMQGDWVDHLVLKESNLAYGGEEV